MGHIACAVARIYECKIWSGNPKKRDHLEDRGMNCCKILKHMREEVGVGAK